MMADPRSRSQILRNVNKTPRNQHNGVQKQPGLYQSPREEVTNSKHIKTKKSQEKTDSKKPKPVFTKEGTFVKDESDSTSDIIHPRITSSNKKPKPLLVKSKMEVEDFDFDSPLPASPKHFDGPLPNISSTDTGEMTKIKSSEKPKRNMNDEPQVVLPLPETPDFDNSFSPVPIKSDRANNLAQTPTSHRGSVNPSRTETVRNISSKEQNVSVISSGAETPVRHKPPPRTSESLRSQTVAPELLDPPLVQTQAATPHPDTPKQPDPPRGDSQNKNLLTATDVSQLSPPPKSDGQTSLTSPQDLADNWDSRTNASRANSAKTEKSSVPGQPVLYKKPISSRRQKQSGYDSQEMLRNAARGNDPPENNSEKTKPIFGTNWGSNSQKTEKTLEDERVLKLTEMLNQMEEQLRKSEEENKQLKNLNRTLEDQMRQQKDSQAKANNEVQLIRIEWQTITKDLESKATENEQLREQLRNKGQETSQLNEVNEEQVKLKLENSNLKTELEGVKTEHAKQSAEKEHLLTELNKFREEEAKLQLENNKLQAEVREVKTQRENENKAHESRVQELEALMMSKEAEVKAIKSRLTQGQGQTDNELARLREEIERLKAENKRLRDEIEALKSAAMAQATVNNRLDVTLNLRLEEIEKYKTNISELEKESKANIEDRLKSQVEIASLKEKNILLEKEVERLKITIQNLNKENQNLMEITSSTENNRTELKLAQNKASALEKELEQAVSDRDAARKALQDRERELATDFLSQEQMKFALQNSETQNAKLSKEVNNLSEENAALKLQVSKKSGDVETLNLKVVELHERAENNSIALSSMADLVKEKQAHIEDLRNEIHTLKSTNSNYYNKLEDITSTKRQDDDIVKSKLGDLESAHKKLLEENKRLRTVLAHKNMSETNQDSEKDALRERLAQTEKELSDAEERIEHLEKMLEDVYKAREITGSRNSRAKGFFTDDDEDEYESHAAGRSLPELPNSTRNKLPKKGRKTHESYSEEPFRATQTSQSGRSWELRNYRYANTYSKRFENRPNKLKHAGVVTQLK